MNKMKAIFKKLSLIITAVIIFPSLNGQPRVDTLPDPYDFIERLVITTDRDLYFTGEHVLIKICKTNLISGTPSPLSRIIYAEMLDRSNDPVARIKISAEGISGSGYFVIPDTVRSGNYTIRAYTRWMLNYSETLFSHRFITIINPFGKFDGNGKNNLKESVVRNDPPSFNSNRIEHGKDDNPEKGMSLNIKTDKTEYACRTKVSINISSLDPGFNLRDGNVSVSVVKQILSGHGKSGPDNAIHDQSGNLDFINDTLKLPEVEGEIISGTIRDRTTNEPLSEAGISLSVVGKESRCLFSRTGSDGEFTFPVRGLYGMNDIVIQPIEFYKNGYYVDLNEPFANSFIDLQVPDFYLDSAKAEQINNSIISMQVNKLYESSFKKSDNNTYPDWKYEFYDTPDKRIFLSDYIELTNIREVVREILREVSVAGKEENARFKIVYRNPFGKFENPALVLVDGVPVRNITKLLEVPSRLMERIDIINVRYFYSDFIFDGILSFVTKKGNLSDLGYDDSVFRQVFEGCVRPNDFFSPSYESDSLKNSHLPDFRNTLYWDPLAETDENGKINLEFYTSDEPGDYLIRVEGIAANGKYVSGIKSIRVK